MTVTGMIHSTAALFTIACLVLPFFGASLGKLSRESVIKRGKSLGVLLRLANFALIVSLITGLIRSGFMFTTWLLVVFVIFLAIAALVGILSKTMKMIKQSAEQNEDYRQNAAKFFRLSIVLAVAIIAMLVVKLT
jgi:4-hydroxybenzoate polyprenyltransferase